MKLSAEEKSKLIKISSELLENYKSPRNSQIRKYASLAMQADCYDEFENYIKYQIGRSDQDQLPFLNKTLEKVMEIKKSEPDDSRCLLKIAYLFGVMAREKQYKEKIERGDRR
ncbi:MAG TPA: hypothetical protein ENO32_07315 [Mesoaciditoga lauensis]|uniref:CRISPR type III-B/RAMP module-associated protein Cmr5 n=1 Tax=Caldisericum exile TaxID=693075 RepID=A0A2J6X475_9BACT|nr:MAG: hypothetical protein C0175_06095 [Caldisericum exile]HEU24902.1 hypothetical protein [Mesoaciditoga lauensis]